jgi:phage N-6-adenine-methyltransferase
MAMPKQKPGKSKQDYTTPPEFIQACCNRLKINFFSMDLAASHENAIARTYFTEKEDSLNPDLTWNPYPGCWAWLNPPYSKIYPWVEKAAREAEKGAHICVLVPASVGSDWWQEWVNPYAYVSFLKGRLTFGGTLPNPKTGKPDPYPKDCALLLYTPWQFAGNEIWDWRNSVPQLQWEGPSESEGVSEMPNMSLQVRL